MFRKSFIYMGGQGLSSVISFILLPLYTKYLSPQDFGLGSLLLISIAFGSMFFAFGLNTGYLIKYYKINDEQKKKMFSVVAAAFLVVTPITLLTIPITPLLRSIFGERFNIIHWILLGSAIQCALYYEFFLTILRVQLRANLFVVYSVGYAVLVGTLNICFLVIFKLGYFSFLYSIAIANFCFMLIGCFILRSLFVRIFFRKDVKEFLHLMKISWVIMPNQINSNILTSGDRYVINAMAGAGAVGIYSIAYRFGALFESFLNVPFFNVYNPIAYKQFSEDKERFQGLQSKFLIVYTLILCGSFVSFNIVFEQLFKMFIDQRYWSAYPLIILIVLSYVFQGISYIFEVVQAMYEKLHFIMYLSFSCAFLNLGLNFILIPYWGIIGSAISNLICYFLMAVGTFIFNNKIMRINYDIKRALMIVFICVVTVILQQVVNVSNAWLNLFIKGIWAMVCFSILYLINFSLINALIKKVVRC